MKYSMRILVAVACLIFSASAFGQGYSIQFKVDGLKDTTAYLGFYQWESTYIKDTARVDSKGEFVFNGKQNLTQGVYLLVLDRTRVFDFVVGSDQNFILETNTTDAVKNMTVKNDPDNKLFFENLTFLTERHAEADPFLKVIRDSTLTEDQKKSARENFSKINDKVMAYQTQIIADNPNLLTARIINASRPVTVPDPPKKPNGSIDSTFQLRWIREHFFDHIDLGDEALIRLPQPIYKEKVNEYLDKLYAPHPDTIFRAIEKIMAMAKKNQETYKYLGYINILKYQQPEIMGLDEVFVKLYDRYFATGEMDYWANAAMKKSLKDHADRLRKSLVGQIGHNLIMQDANLKRQSMYDLKNKYTVLFIFDPECGHCRKETPILVDFYKKNRTRFNLEVFAVSADSSMSKMKKFIKEFNTTWITVNGPRTYVGSYHDYYDAMTTPSLYILDEKKKIIAKKIPIEKIEEFLMNYEKFQKNKASPKL
jgi:thiol-disulfide isomerase/thioredoxin